MAEVQVNACKTWVEAHGESCEGNEDGKPKTRVNQPGYNAQSRSGVINKPPRMESQLLLCDVRIAAPTVGSG